MPSAFVTHAPTAVASVSPKPSPVASPTPTASAVNYIPGLQSADIKVNLEKTMKMKFTGAKETKTIGIDIDTGKLADPDTGASIICEIVGELPLHVKLINVVITGTDKKSVDATSSYFFEYVASVPYDGADQVSASQWAKASVASVKQGSPLTSTFGGVNFEISGSELSRFMRISAQQQSTSEDAGGLTQDMVDALKNL